MTEIRCGDKPSPEEIHMLCLKHPATLQLFLGTIYEKHAALCYSIVCVCFLFTHGNLKHVSSLSYILAYLYTTFPHSLAWVPQALGQFSCNTQGWKS